MNKWDKIEKENEYIMERMHPAVMIPGFFIGFMVIIGCIFKGYMGWYYEFCSKYSLYKMLG